MSTTVEPWLRGILRCPACRSTLLDVPGDDGPAGLRCAADAGDGCGRTYRFERGVPVLLVDEGVLPAADGPVPGTHEPAPGTDGAGPA